MGDIYKEWEGKHRGSSDFLKREKTGKEPPVVITLLIWEMGGIKVSFIILLIEKWGILKYH